MEGAEEVECHGSRGSGVWHRRIMLGRWFGWAVLDYAAAKRVADRSGAGFCALVSGGGSVAKWSKVPGLSARTQISERNRRSMSPVEGRRPVSRWSLRHFGGRRKASGWFSARANCAATHSRA